MEHLDNFSQIREPAGFLLPPGSDEAVAAGCTCPVLDNARGRGYMGRPGVFVFRAGCPIHHRPEATGRTESRTA